MLTHPLAERLRAVDVAAMVDAFLEMQNLLTATDLKGDDCLCALVNQEVTARDSMRLARRLTQARFRQNKVAGEFASAHHAVWSGLCSINAPLGTGSNRRRHLVLLGLLRSSGKQGGQRLFYPWNPLKGTPLSLDLAA
jgi:hypothetical protein